MWKLRWSYTRSLLTYEWKRERKRCASEPHFGRYVCSESTLCLATPANIQDNFASLDPSSSIDSSSSDQSEQGSKSSRGNGLSRGEIAEIVIPIVGILAAVGLAWWKRHQVVWCVTCGRHGHKHTIRTPRRISSVPYGTQLLTMPPRRDPDHPPSFGSQQFFIINGSNQQSLNPSR